MGRMINRSLTNEHPLAVLWVVTALASCGGSNQPAKGGTAAGSTQSMKEVTELICDVDRRAGLVADGDPVEAESSRHDYLTEHITNPDGIYFYTLLRAKDPKEAAKMLADQAKEMGFSKCKRAESLEASAKE
jgi:hypothetical protein